MSQSDPITAYATPPGDTLDETLSALGMSPADLARRSGIAEGEICGVIRGKMHVSQKMAQALEQVLKVPAHFWLNLDNRYRQRA